MTINSKQVRLNGELSIRNCMAVAAELRAAIVEHQSVAIETNDLMSLDVSILQLLIAAHKAAERNGSSLRIQVVGGGALDRALKASGLAQPCDAVLVREGEFWTGVRADGGGLAA